MDTLLVLVSLIVSGGIVCFCMYTLSQWMRRENEAWRQHATHMVSLVKVSHPKELEATAEQMFGGEREPLVPKEPPDPDVDAELGIPH